MSASGATADARRERLLALYHEASDCHKCPLAATRTKVVFGNGNADAGLMFVGEAPGAEEDRQGLPFVGRAGGLLSELLGPAPAGPVPPGPVPPGPVPPGPVPRVTTSGAE